VRTADALPIAPTPQDMVFSYKIGWNTLALPGFNLASTVLDSSFQERLFCIRNIFERRIFAYKQQLRKGTAVPFRPDPQKMNLGLRLVIIHAFLVSVFYIVAMESEDGICIGSAR
jgi:hypothetical protein